MKRKLVAGLSILVFALSLPAAENAASSAAATDKISYGGGVDWRDGGGFASIEIDVTAAGLKMPGARADAERLIAERKPDAVRDLLYPVLIDSRDTIESAVVSGRLSVEALKAAVAGAKARTASFGPDFSTFSIEYRFSLSPIVEALAAHAASVAAPRYLGFVPTKKYTGILIYVPDALPVWGEKGRTAQVRPCLLPVIRDEATAVVYERDTADPEVLKAEGLVAYASSLEDPAIARRIGEDPLRLLAVGVYGHFPTDPMLAREDVLKIAADPDNRELLKKGRVAIVCPLNPP
jgi:hypothetical protein